ncbi:hypothetical protein GW923_04105 [Candidatus Pacearchaeota archaeon]|nr:hypothetical protein [Candidatus Pacearchaeota archaeon]
MEPRKIGHYDWFDLESIERLAEKTGTVNPNLISPLSEIKRYIEGN